MPPCLANFNSYQQTRDNNMAVESLLAEASSLPWDKIRVGGGIQRERLASMKVAWEQLQAYARVLREKSAGTAALEAATDDLSRLMNFVRPDPSGGYREFRDNGDELFRLIERATNILRGVASAYGLMLAVSADGKWNLVGAVKPSELGLEGRLERAEQHLDELHKAVSPETVRLLNKVLQEAHEARETLARILREAAVDATKIKVGDYRTFFAVTATKHRASAKRWLSFTAVLAIITIISAGIFVRGAPDAEGGLEAALTRSVFIAVLVSATVWSGLNFRSHQHNAVVNEHRGDALGSFDAFWNAAKTDQAKDAVLVQASNAIYLPQASGFVGQSGEASTSGVGLLAGLLASRSDK